MTTLGSLVYVYMNLIESPIFLVNKMRFDEARVNLAKIAAFNGLTENFENTEFTKEADIKRSMQALAPAVSTSFDKNDTKKLQLLAMHIDCEERAALMPVDSDAEESMVRPADTTVLSTQAIKAPTMIDDEYS